MAFQDIDQEEVEIEVGAPPVTEEEGPTVEEILAEKQANADRIRQLEAEAETLKSRESISQISELLAQQQKNEEYRRAEEARQTQTNAGPKPMTDEEMAIWEGEFLKDPKKGMKDFKKSLMDNEVLPLMKGMYAELQQVKLQTSKQSSLVDPINKDIYGKYKDEVEAAMRSLNPANGDTFTTALDLVKSRHLSEIIAAEVAKQSAAAAESTTTIQNNGGTSTKAGNSAPPISGIPEGNGDNAKKKVYVSPELWAKKPASMDDRMYLNYLKNTGVIK